MHQRDGFSVLEVLVAISVLTVALTGLAQCYGVSTRANANARHTTYASLLAQQKMEQLRGLTWGFDPLGLPISDMATNITVVPESPDGGTGLTPSPPGALGINTDGYCDFVDRNGAPLGGCAYANPVAAYVRRWSIEPLPANPGNTIVIQVLVAPIVSRSPGDTSPGPVTRRLNEARLVSVKTRKAS